MSETQKIAEMLGNFIQEPEIGIKNVTLNRFKQHDSESFYIGENKKYTEDNIEKDLDISEQKIVDFFENKSTTIIMIPAVKDFYDKNIFEHLEKFLLKSDTKKWISGEKGYFFEVNFGKDISGKTIITRLKITKDREKFEQVENEIAQQIKQDKEKQEYLEKYGILNRIKTKQEKMKLQQKVSLEKLETTLSEVSVSQQKILSYFSQEVKGNTHTIEISLSEKNKEVLGEYIYHAAILYLYENQNNKEVFEKGVSILSRNYGDTNNYKLKITIKRRQMQTPFYVDKVDLIK